VTFFGEDLVRSTASYTRVLNGSGDANVFIIPINKRIKDTAFLYEVNEGQPKWIGQNCPLILEYVFIAEEVITRTNDVVEYNISLPSYTQDAQITTE